MKKVIFMAMADETGVRDGDEGYEIFIDGVKIDELRGDETEIGALPESFWTAIDVSIEHDYSKTETGETPQNLLPGRTTCKIVQADGRVDTHAVYDDTPEGKAQYKKDRNRMRRERRKTLRVKQREERPQLLKDISVALLVLGLDIDRLERDGFSDLMDLKHTWLRLHRYLRVAIPSSSEEARLTRETLLTQNLDAVFSPTFLPCHKRPLNPDMMPCLLPGDECHCAKILECKL